MKLVGVVDLVPLYAAKGELEGLVMHAKPIIEVAPPPGLSVRLVVMGTEVHTGR